MLKFAENLRCYYSCPFFVFVFFTSFFLKFNLFQEVVFYEDGEPIIDGEPGDLKVGFQPLFVICMLCIHCATDNNSHTLYSSVFAQQPMIPSEGKEMTCIQL